MALKSISVPVNDVPQVIARNTGKFGKMQVFVSNLDVNNDVHVGGSEVTTLNGYVLTKFTTTGVGNKFSIELFAGDTLYCVCAAGKSGVVGVLLTGQFDNQ